MKVAFHSNQLCIRGTSVQMYDYAHYNEEILGNESIVIYDEAWGEWNQPLGITKFKERFPVFSYCSGDLQTQPSDRDFSGAEEILSDQGVDVMYMIKGGDWDGKVSKNVKTCVHAIGYKTQPHGDVYVYGAPWCAEKSGAGKFDWLAPMYCGPTTVKENLRKNLGIPETAIVFGRHGGKDQFDIPMAHQIVEHLVKQRSDIYFLLLNTNRFCEEHPQIIHLDPTYNLQEKADFIIACDAMIHARQMGEIYSLSMGEFLYHGKPIISWPGGWDDGHIHMLGEKGLWYKDPNELYRQLYTFDPNNQDPEHWKAIISDCTPEKVMQKFKKLFLD